MTTAELLALARGKNDEFHRLCKAKQLQPARNAMIEAMTARLTAHEADPDHVDVAWAADRAPHAQIMAYYEARLAAFDA